jgi:hypothetical protein
MMFIVIIPKNARVSNININYVLLTCAFVGVIINMNYFTCSYLSISVSTLISFYRYHLRNFIQPKGKNKFWRLN